MQEATHDELVQEASRWFSRPTVCMTATSVSTRNGVPDSWMKLLGLRGQSLHSSLGKMWEGCRNCLPSVFTFVTSRVQFVSVVFDGDTPSLVYGYEDSDGAKSYYIGGVPLEQRIPGRLSHIWGNIPRNLSSFYSIIHDGWVTWHSFSRGPLPVNHLSLLSDPSWDLQEGPEEKLGFRWRDILAVAGNGGGDYVCLDTSYPDLTGERSGFLYYHEHPLQPGRPYSFWNKLDYWMGVAFDEY